MLSEEDVELDHIEEALSKIDEKYSTTPNFEPKNSLEHDLMTLSEEFETFGFAPLNLHSPTNQILEEVVKNASSLVHLHRKTLSDMTDLALNNREKDIKKHDQVKVISDLKAKVATEKQRSLSLDRQLHQSLSVSSDLKSSLADSKEEIKKVKRYYSMKENELQHQINALKKENLSLKEKFGHNIDKFCSKDDKFLKIIKKYKHNEEVNQSIIKKLEENNAAIVHEVLNLKEELALIYVNKNKED